MKKPILITGASSGIGYELAKVCAAHGHDLILVARREEPMKALKAQLESAPPPVQVLTYRADLTCAATRQQLFDWTQTQTQGKPLYGLINNAGFGDLSEFAKADWDKIDAMLQLNIVALTHLTRLYLPGLIEQQQGRIMNVASTAAFLPGTYMAVYYASKAYVLSFTEALATELKDTGVTATTLCPGPTYSEFQDRANLGDIPWFNDSTLPTAADVATFGYSAMEKGQRTAVHGTPNKVLTFATRLLPRKQLANIIGQMQKDGLDTKITSEA
ncbi:SDR family oxidoreductase [Nodosilinea sp. P-1105]|uniref:SDR family NAD(P)-dependent oxidoreductase n=1 Tax=Nodosilinea sp. P-1105 TaxID=2546229 RepID=UPI00146A69BA|nr:SDR family oxidoreductase [Nodosilinea sp. P-1105]NMF85120.1 SDR family oxidoreductase [Nodosilinea sp. P-1105]